MLQIYFSLDKGRQANKKKFYAGLNIFVEWIFPDLFLISLYIEHVKLLWKHKIHDIVP